ncbi:hypothetical protein CQW23_27727 [Capsicum baccatum]|uniref:F-box associated domain-containing protein n=1 Tax=Capsicum baccatum TaxID=33114 RepID=A0A2G2VEH7_CAPBA|nr:hypothetical protein CQW23_27727 [Capsicum baccatum]
MVFRMDKEEFSAMPHPGSSTVCNSKQAHQTMMLSVKDDRLCFSNLLFRTYTVDIWIKRYKIDLLNERIFPFSSRLMGILRGNGDTDGWIKLLCIHEGELLLLYNLDYTTVKKIELPRNEMFCYTCMPYTKSFLAIA